MSFADELKKIDPVEEQRKIELKQKREQEEAEKQRHNINIQVLKNSLPSMFKYARVLGLLNNNAHDFCFFYSDRRERHGIVLCSENELIKTKTGDTFTGIVEDSTENVHPLHLRAEIYSAYYDSNDVITALRELGFRNVSVKTVACKHREQSPLWALLGEKTVKKFSVSLYHIELK